MDGMQATERPNGSLILKMAGVNQRACHVPGTGQKRMAGGTARVNENKGKDLAASFTNGRKSMIMPDADSQETMLRCSLARLYKSYLILSEIMFSGMAGVYIEEAVQGVKEAGLYRQKAKKLTNELQAVKDDMYKKSISSDADMVEVFCKVIFPYFAKQYVDEGGSMAENLQMMFHREFMDELRRIEFCTKNVFDKVRAKESGLGATLSMVLLISNTLKELKEALENRVKIALPGYPAMNTLLHQQNAKMLAVTQNLMCEIGLWNIDFPEKEGMEARQLAATFQVKLLKEDMLERVQHVISASQMDYTEYTIAHLKMDLLKGNGKLPFGYYRVLLMRLGTHDNVLHLLQEIDELPDPEDVNGEVMEFKYDLPEVPRDSLIFHFRRLCVEDKIMVPDAKDLVPVRLRYLRAVADRNGGVLPMEELQKLYKKLGTKKAMMAVLKQAGPELNKTMALLKITKVDALRRK